MSAVAPSKPSLDLLRSMTDEQVLRQLLQHGRATRAELSAWTGISKPTMSESVRRLGDSGVVIDTGLRSSGRGRSGSYYALDGGLGTALAISMAPEVMTAELVTPLGETVAQLSTTVRRPARPARVAGLLKSLAEETAAIAPAPIRVAVVSAADPVDRTTGRLVHLPDAPFLLGDLSPTPILAPLVDGPVIIDNDVNWAARAERTLSENLDDFVYLYLGAGLGAALVSDGKVHRGHTGTAGEIAHMLTTGPAGRSIRFIDVFEELGLRQARSTAIDTARLIRATSGDDITAASVRAAVAQAVSGVLAGALALADPATIVLGGTWGMHPPLVAAVMREFSRHPRSAPVRAARAGAHAPLVGARNQALVELGSYIVSRARSGPADS